jgi:hypothetical protein
LETYLLLSKKPSLKIKMRVIHRGRFEAQTDDSRIRIREKNQRVSDEEGADPAETGRKNWFYQRLSVKSRKYKKAPPVSTLIVLAKALEISLSEIFAW